MAIFFLQKIIRPSADLRNHNSEISRQCKEENEAVIITVNGSSFTSRCPLKVVETNGCPTAQIVVLKNVFSIILYVDMDAEYEDATPNDTIL